MTEINEDVTVEFSEKLEDEIRAMQRVTGLKNGELIRIGYSLFAVHVEASHQKRLIAIDTKEGGCVPFVIPSKLGPMYTSPGTKTTFAISKKAVARTKEICRAEGIDLQTFFMRSIFVLTVHLDAASHHRQVRIKTGLLQRDLAIDVLKHVRLSGPYTAPGQDE